MMEEIVSIWADLFQIHVLDPTFVLADNVVNGLFQKMEVEGVLHFHPFVLGCRFDSRVVCRTPLEMEIGC